MSLRSCSIHMRETVISDLPVDETDLDFASNIKMKSKKGKKGGEDDSDSDLDGDLDEEESLGSLDEEDFGDELEGPSFIDSIGEDDEEGMSQFLSFLPKCSLPFTILK